MSLSTQVTIKTKLETFEFYCGSRRLGQAFGLHQSGDKIVYTDEDACAVIDKKITSDSGIGRLRSFFICELADEAKDGWMIERDQGTDSDYVDWLIIEVELFG